MNAKIYYDKERDAVVYEKCDYVACFVFDEKITDLKILVEKKDQSDPILFDIKNIDISDDFELHYECIAYFPNGMNDQEKESWHWESREIFAEFVAHIIKELTKSKEEMNE